MGKFATYQKRGTSYSQFSFAAPQVGDWSIGTITASSIAANRTFGLPPGVAAFQARAIPTAGGATTLGNNTASTASTVSGLAGATQYNIQIRYTGGSSSQPLSDWSDVKTATTS